MKILISSSLILLLSACSSIPNESNFESIHLRKLNDPLSVGAQVSVQIPENGRFEDTVYSQSGQDTASAFKSAFEVHTESVTLLSACQEEACLAGATQAGSKYFAALKLVYWEDRATNWSNKADRLTIKVSIYDVSSSSLLTSSYLHTNTSMGAPSGGHVEDFLPSLANQYVSSLY